MQNRAILYDFQTGHWQKYVYNLPPLKNDETLVKVAYAGLCGSDMHRVKNPSKHESEIVMGHEVSGIVVASSNEKLVGKSVAVNPIGNCRKCFYCEHQQSQFCNNSRNIGKNVNGAFADYVIAPTKNVYITPADFPLELGVFADGVAVVLHSLQKLTFSPRSALIIGDGTMGCLFVAVLKALYSDIKIALKGRHNVDLIKKIYHIDTEFKDEEFDLTVETVGRAQSDTLNDCIRQTVYGGSVLVTGVYPPDFALSLDARTAFYKELKIYGVNSFCVSAERDDFAEALQLIEKHHSLFAPLITHHFSLDDFEKGVEKMSDKRNSPVVKVVYEPN